MSAESNKIPEGWEETTLGSIIKLIGGGTPKTSIKKYWNGNIPWLSVVDFNSDDRWVYNTEKHITEEGLKNSSTKLLKKGDLIISARGTVGALAQLDKKMAFNQSCYGIKEKPEISKEDYLYYLTKYSVQKISRNVHGAVFDTITRQTFDFINVLIPIDTNEQQAIAEVLSAFDNKIALLHQQNKTLENLAQTLFKEWFGKESSQKEFIPLDEVADISSSKRIFRSEYVAEGIPFYRSKEIIELSSKPEISTELFITFEKFKQIKNKFGSPQKGDILLTAVGTLGVPFKVRDDKPFYFKDGNLIWFKNFKMNISSDFVFIWLKFESTQQSLKTISIGSTQKALTISSLKKLMLPIFKNHQSQVEANVLLASFSEKLDRNILQIQELQKTRDTLLPKLMNGSVRVKEFQH